VIFAIVPIELFQTRALTLEEIRVMGVLFSFRGRNTDLVWPSRGAIAERCGYDKNKITHITSSLVKKGWLVKVQSANRSVAYRLSVPEVVSQSDTTQGGLIGHQGVSCWATPIPYREHTKEHKTNANTNTRVARERFDPLQMVLPDVIPASVWQDLVVHRREIRKPLTERAANLMSRRLVEMAARGVDLRAAVDQSIRSGWQDVYEQQKSTQRNGAKVNLNCGDW
jgi:hypothetical protein